MFAILLLVLTIFQRVYSEVTSEDLQFLNKLSIEKLLRLKSSLQELVTPKYENITVSEPSYLQRFGAQAMAMKGPPIKRTDYEGIWKKGSHSKISSIFTMSVSTLAFLAFGGYLLCLIVYAMRSKQMINTNVPQPTFFVSAGIKKRPQAQFTSYGRRRRRRGIRRPFGYVSAPNPSPEELFSALLKLCEGYAKWTNEHDIVPKYSENLKV